MLVAGLDAPWCWLCRWMPHAERGDARAQHAAAGLVDLHGHQPRRELDDMGFEPQILQRLGRFQSEQAAADHRRRTRAATPAARIASRSSMVR